MVTSAWRASRRSGSRVRDPGALAGGSRDDRRAGAGVRARRRRGRHGDVPASARPAARPSTDDNDTMPGVIAVPVGAFADPTFPPPQFSVYGVRRHPWVRTGDLCDRRARPTSLGSWIQCSVATGCTATWSSTGPPSTATASRARTAPTPTVEGTRARVQRSLAAPRRAHSAVGMTVPCESGERSTSRQLSAGAAVVINGHDLRGAVRTARRSSGRRRRRGATSRRAKRRRRWVSMAASSGSSRVPAVR